MVHWKSHLLIRPQREKRPKLEESKEIEWSNYGLDIANATLQHEVDEMNQKLVEYKVMLNDSQKYQEIVENLIKKGIINEHGEEKIIF